MATSDFKARYAKAIAALWGAVEARYGVTEAEFAARVQASAARCLAGGAAQGGAGAEARPADEREVSAFLAQLKSGELCLAIACERGDEAAWRDFETGYRHTMVGAARALTKDEAEAEDLAQTVSGELFGVRAGGAERASKFAHYSGRGSLGGWLRAVVYQTFIDRTRAAARFAQVEDASEFERLANNAEVKLSAPSARPDEVFAANGDEKLRRATEAAMSRAFDALEARDRLLLNYYYFDELTLREIGVLFNVHEATVSRRLARVQQQVRKKTEELLRREHGLRRAEVAECLEMAARAEVDLRRMIGEAKSASAERAP
jgi:RNA polymerase sigma-70 factor, ECF subfamily